MKTKKYLDIAEKNAVGPLQNTCLMHEYIHLQQGGLHVLTLIIKWQPRRALCSLDAGTCAKVSLGLNICPSSYPSAAHASLIQLTALCRAHVMSKQASWCAGDRAVSARRTAGGACSGRRTGGRLSSAGPRVLRRSSSPAATPQ